MRNAECCRPHGLNVEAGVEVSNALVLAAEGVAVMRVTIGIVDAE